VFQEAGKFAKFIELLTSDDVERVWEGYSVLDMFISDGEVFDMHGTW